ncbi:MAG: PQQ-binding-like beta-propeller repeat protein [Planctomycetota bacterium]
MSILRRLALTIAGCCFATIAQAEDWPRFLGSKGDATADDSTIPIEWSADSNIQWRTPLPGPGASSPIVVGDRVFLTYYTGYGDGSSGTIDDLVRHLACFDRKSGTVLWTKSVRNKPGSNEDPYESYLTHHGYATNTPISDGESVFVYFGKPGLFAFDLDGNQLWHLDVESKVNKTRWGSAASLIFYESNLILNAVEENGHILSVNTTDGTVKWKFNTESSLVYATPNLLKTAAGDLELIVPAPEKVFGIDPETGKEKWFVTTTLQNEMNGSVIVEDDIAYMYGGFRGVGSLAVRGGGSGDVTDSHVVWTSKDTSYIATPVLKDGHLYWLDMNGVAHTVNAETGERIQRRRTPGVRGGRSVKFFASMLLSGDYVYAVSRQSGTFVLKATPEFPLVAHNKIDDDESEFNGSPAVSNNQLFLRSNEYLYCISE